MTGLTKPRPSKALFLELAELAQSIMQTRGTNAKIALCSSYFQGLELNTDLERAAQFLGEGAFSSISGKRASVGSRTISKAAAEFCEIDYDKVFKPSKMATGSASETIEKLMRNIENARAKQDESTYTLGQVETLFERLYQVSSRKDKQEILWEAFTHLSPVEIKYFLRMLRQGSLRIGFEEKSVISALAQAFDQKVQKVRYVHMITGSAGRTAVLCGKDDLEQASFKLFNPISFMLASPMESHSVDDITQYIAEEKFDGMRCQLHVSTDQVQLFSRDLNDITRSFPEIATHFLSKDIQEMVLDGEICVYREETIQPFQLLQKRLRVNKPSKNLLAEYPVLFIAFDMLYVNGNPLFDQPLEIRRKYLQQYAQTHQIAISRQFDVQDHVHLIDLFNRAVDHGNEGMMLKERGSRYEYGQRRNSWLKVKKPGGSIDTILMYAHAGSGKRGDTYSDFTLGVRVKEDERYEEEFIPIGKLYGGYTDEELKKLNAKIKELIVEKYGPTLGLLPELVIELEFDDIQVNKRTKANYTLRSPRFRAIRWDLGPKDVDTLIDVERMYQQKMQQKRVSQREDPSFVIHGE
ncbi:MAG: ATP-dependent DNA ligase [Bacteroidota bacterium]